MGFEEALAAWTRFLRPRGMLVVSELMWISERPYPEERAFWESAYPSMRGQRANRIAAEAAGFAVIGETRLPHRSWFTDYLTPLKPRLDEMRSTCATEAVGAWLDEQRREIDIAKAFNGFGYVFLTLRRRGRKRGVTLRLVAKRAGR